MTVQHADLRTAAREVYDLVEPIHLVTYFAPEPTAALTALGLRNYWDGYFAGRAAPLGLASAEVVDAVFYNFGPGEVRRHIPYIWTKTTPEQALDARTRGATAALSRIIGDDVAPEIVADAAERALNVALHAPPDGRPMFTALLSVSVPHDPLGRFWHAATLLREHRGDGHNLALLNAGINGLEAHLMHAVSIGIPAESFGRVHHLSPEIRRAALESLQQRGILTATNEFTDQGDALKRAIEQTTDDLAATALAELDRRYIGELIESLRPASAIVSTAGSR